MSPTKKRSKKPQKAQNAQKALTIDFSGICTLVWDKKAGTATVRLVDLGAAGFQRHYASLGVAVNERTPKALRGPEAEAAISLSESNTDLGLWNLMGCDVRIVGATGKLTVDDSKVDVTKKPTKKDQSIRWLADIGYLAESTDPNGLCPTAATVVLPAGHLTGNAAVGSRRITFTENNTPVGPTRYCVPRLRATIAFADELAIVLDRRRILRFRDSMSIMIANTCVCVVGTIGPDHFYAHYDVVDAKRRPKVGPPQSQSSGSVVVAAPQVAAYPELCFMGYVEI